MKYFSNIPVHFLPSNEFLSLGRIENTDKSDFDGQHRHHFYEILWFTEVKANETHQIDFEEYKIEPNHIYILSPNQVHTMDRKSHQGYILAFSKDFFHSAFEMPAELFLQPYFFHTRIDDSLSIILHQLMKLMFEEYQTYNRKKILEAYCTAFIMHLSGLKEKEDSKHSDRIVKVLRLIDQEFYQEKEVSFYANAVSLSERRLNEICVKNTGQTVKQLLIDRTITEAKRLISSGKNSVKEIAYHLGFNDPAYFSRLFRKKTQFTPEEYKKVFSN